MTGEVAFAYLHFVSLGLLYAFLVAELVAYRPRLTAEEAKTVAFLDLGYGLAALAAAATGFTRAFFLGKGWEFYAGNPLFWTKVAIFLAVAFLSLPPTFHFLSWRTALKAGRAPAIDPGQYRRMRGFIMAELSLLPLIPLFAVLMARGVGIR